VDRQGKIKEYVLPLPEGQLRLGFDVQRHDRRLREEERGVLGICLAGLLLTLGGMVFLARRLLAPLRRLTEAAEEAAQGRSPLPVYASGEFAGLTRSFEKLTGALRHLERVRDLFALYLGPEVLRRVLKEENPAELGAEERAVTVAVFSLAGFGAVSRRSGPRETLRLLNEHLPHVLDAILDGRGVVDRLEGEVLVAIWGAPDDVQEPEYKATCAALAARTALEGEAKRQAAAGGQTLQLTVGICTGRAAVGHIGSAKRISYRVLGGPVELAGQVQRMARPGEILLAETTYTKISNRIEVVSAAPLMLPEMDEALPLYRLKRLVG
jgi:adenylate cyclase